jgi:hypothetical protein
MDSAEYLTRSYIPTFGPVPVSGSSEIIKRKHRNADTFVYELETSG